MLVFLLHALGFLESCSSFGRGVDTDDPGSSRSNNSDLATIEQHNKTSTELVFPFFPPSGLSIRICLPSITFLLFIFFACSAVCMSQNSQKPIPVFNPFEGSFFNLSVTETIYDYSRLAIGPKDSIISLTCSSVALYGIFPTSTK